MGPDIRRGVPGDARSRHPEPAHRRLRTAQRAGLLARRERPLHQRHAPRPHPCLRLAAQWGMLAKHTDRVFADLRGPEPGVPDGMKVDVEGNVYCGGTGGIWIMDKTGKKLGRIVHGGPATTNLAFGGDDWRTLYITSRNHLGAVKVKIPGIAVPVAAK